jgi:hypothetical protein
VRKLAEEASKTTQEMPRETKKEELFDLLIPPGVPRRIIKDVLEKFDVQLVERKQRLYYANMSGDERELLAFRGKREVVEQAEKFMLSELNKYVNE